MNLPPDLAAKCLALAGQPAATRERKPPAPLVEPAVARSRGRVAVTVPVRVESEANAGGTLRAALARKASVKRAVFLALAPHWRAWGPFGDRLRAGAAVRVRLVRIGGRMLDRANLPRAMKSAEDALATMLGASDGSPLWCVEWAQEPGDLYGVRIELSLEK